MKQKVTVRIIVLLLLLSLLVGCGGGGNISASEDRAACPTCSDPTPAQVSPAISTIAHALTLTGDLNQTPLVQENGLALSSDQVAQMMKALPITDSSTAITLALAPTSATRDIVISAGCYRFMIRWEDGPVNKCFKAAGTKHHLNIELRNKCGNYDIFNLHIVPWNDGTLKVGVYESVSGKCYTLQRAYNAVKNFFSDLLAAVGLWYVADWASGALADIAWPLILVM